MRIRILPLAIGLLALSGMSGLKAGSGGPDAYGYIWKDSNEPTGPAYAWTEIVGLPGTVQVTGLGDDNAVGQFNIGWDFHYYWSDYNKVKVGSNGWISFANVGNIASCFPTVPTAGGAGDNLVVPFMSDLTFVSNAPANPNIGTIHYWTNSVDSFIVQYSNVPWWQTGTPDWKGSNTFQILLNGQDSSITFYYKDTDAANLATSAGCPNTSFEIGIENLTGNLGLNAASGVGAAVPADSMAIRFYYPAVVTFQVPDASPVWAANSDNAGQFVYTNAAIDLTANLSNVGNAPITNSISITGKVRKHPSPTILYTGTTSLSTGLAAGNDSTVTFPTQLTLTSAGQYFYEVTSANGQDINPSNNVNTVELAAVDNLGGFALLSYCTGGLPDGGISWAGGGIDDGVAVKMVPPGYPMTIDSVSLFILGDDADPTTPLLNGFEIRIYGSDANGNVDLNNLLQTETIQAIDGIEDNWNRIALDSSVTVNSGAVFIAWLQGGSGIQIGREAVGPISRRSYEILSSSWAPYRENTVHEFLIQVASNLPVGIGDRKELPAQVRVYPNPSHGVANIAYQTTEVGDVRFSLHNMMGQEVWTKTHGGVSPGEYSFQMDIDRLAKGVYVLNMETAGQRFTQKVVVE